MLKSISIMIFLLSNLSFADCISSNPGKYIASPGDESALDDTVIEAFELENVKNAQVSFENCIFKVKPNFDSNLKTFDHSKNKEKCQQVKTVFEMNLIGCESSYTKSSGTQKSSNKKNGVQ